MKQEISADFLQIVAADIERLLIESQPNIDFSFKRIEDGIKLTLGIKFDATSAGIVTTYTLSFDLEPKPDAPEKHKVSYKHTINTAQASFMETM